jgi:hypothetical protein
MARDEDEPLVEIEIGMGDRSEWESAGRTAARLLHSLFPNTRHRLNVGRSVVVRMDAAEFSRELHGAAVDAFEKEWAQLVPGWQPPPQRHHEEG